LTFMGVSPRKSKSNLGQNVTAKMAFQKILYCRCFFVALLVCVTLPAVTAAQEERPQITPGERKATKKKDAGPRAVGVLQLAANGKASLVPIAILVGGRFWDASAYKADPVPMSLDPGTVYEAERAGSSLGLFTVNSALHSNAANVQTQWLGTGSWVPAGTEKPKTALQAEKEPIGIESNDEPPRLSRGSSPSKPAPPAPPAPASTPGTSSGSPGSGQAPTSTSKPSDSKPGDSKPGDSKTTNTKPNDVKPPDRPAPPQSDSGAAEDNRPRLRRGKPVEPLPEDEVPGYSKPGAVASAAAPANAGTLSPQTAEKRPVQLIPAISDAGGPEPKSFAFEWLKDEEGERLKQMTTLATEQVRAYVAAQAKAKIMPAPLSKSPRSQTTRRSTVSKAPVVKTGEPILENVQMKAYDLWGNNQPVMVFSADAHMPPPPAGTPHAETDSELQYSILLVANPDIYNNLHKLYVSVTDKYHLDMTPRFELVDAVDADGDGRGELLFRETSDNGTGWAIYRATADKLWKLFDSLNPQ
jgi:hypothetical protein